MRSSKQRATDMDSKIESSMYSTVLNARRGTCEVVYCIRGIKSLGKICTSTNPSAYHYELQPLNGLKYQMYTIVGTPHPRNVESGPYTISHCNPNKVYGP